MDVRDEVVSRALGEELRRARESIGWTRDELADRMMSAIQPYRRRPTLRPTSTP